MSENITLFHTTNENSAKLMIKNGIGLENNDYQNYIKLMCEELDVPVEKVISIFNDFKKDAECNGTVSFFQDEKTCMRIVHYGKFGGEWRNLVIERALKRIARLKKVPYTKIKHIGIKYLGTDSEPVIVEVSIPVSMIFNKEMIGKKSELYTMEKVPAKYIVNYKLI